VKDRMTRGRVILGVLVAAALVLSAWTARPYELASPLGWLFAFGWASAAWTILLVATVAGAPLAFIAGALVALVGSELVFGSANSDGFFLAVKPMYQLPVLLIGAAVGHGLARLGATNA